MIETALHGVGRMDQHVEHDRRAAQMRDPVRRDRVVLGGPLGVGEVEVYRQERSILGAADLDGAAAALKGAPGVDLIARFGAELHVAGTHEAMLAASVAALARDGATTEKIPAGLEEAFIYLMTGATDNFAPEKAV